MVIVDGRQILSHPILRVLPSWWLEVLEDGLCELRAVFNLCGSLGTDHQGFGASNDISPIVRPLGGD